MSTRTRRDLCVVQWPTGQLAITTPMWLALIAAAMT